MTELKAIIEKNIEVKSFKAGRLYSEALPTLKSDAKYGDYIDSLSKLFGNEREVKNLILSLLRNAFLIEPVNDQITSTKMGTRWNENRRRQWRGIEDQRYCSYTDCEQIFQGLFEELIKSLQSSKEKLALIRDFLNYKLIAYELPIDYNTAPIEPGDNSKIHRPDNIILFWGHEYQALLELRKVFLNSKLHEHATAFRRILNKKVQVKTYLTDRAQTGDFKTNREKRWEAHPKSAQFAKRRDCLKIEGILLIQLASFKDFPPSLRNILIERGVIRSDEEIYRCPVTLEPLSYPDFEKTIVDPEHGKSDFQVAHLNPLKAGFGDKFRHTPHNVGWISAQGNRIQGKLTLDEVRKMLRDITERYKQAGS